MKKAYLYQLMMLMGLFLIGSIAQAQEFEKIADDSYRLNVNKMSGIEILNLITKNSDYRVAYAQEQHQKMEKLISVTATGSIDNILQEVLKKYNIEFSIEGKQILLKFPEIKKNSNATNISENNTSQESNTNENQEEVASGRTVVQDASQLPSETESGSSKQLDEVVVVGYGTQKKANITSAISSISTSDIDERPMVSFTDALQGKAAGVVASSFSGKPGQNMSILIRGATSVLAGNQPLYVIDGIPTTNLESISPDDIQSIEVLKDASSSAIYGTRGANGVVLITTKRGIQGKVAVGVNANVTFSRIARTLPTLNLDQYKDLMKELNIGGIDELLSGNDRYSKYFDWNKEMYKTGLTQNYEVYVSQATDKFNYYMSGGYTSDKGIINQVSFERYNFRLNLENKLTKWMKVGTNINYSRTVGTNLNFENGGKGPLNGGTIAAISTIPPYIQIWDTTSTKQYQQAGIGVKMNNPLEDIAEKTSLDKYDYLVGQVYGEIQLYKGLKIRSNIGMDYNNGVATQWVDPTTTNLGRTNGGKSTDNRYRTMTLINENLLTYETNIDKHSIDVLGGHTFQRSQFSQATVAGFDFLPNTQITTVNVANQIDKYASTSYASEWSLLSFFGRLNYNYDSKYLLTVNFRADASSKLFPDNKWGYFPSVSGAWRISQEKFMSNVKWLNDLKLRAGWGLTGNVNGLGNYAWQQTYSVSKNEPTGFVYGQIQGGPIISSTPTALYNPDLTWETTSQVNVGIDGTVLDGRLSIGIDAYRKYTTNLLLNVPLPSTSAIGSIIRNDGEMRNLGLEFLVTSRNFISGDFRWNTSFNMSFNNNQVTKLGLAQVYSYSIDQTANSVIRITPGEALGSFYGYISKGVDPETGMMLYQTSTGVSSDPSPSDRTIIGSPWPIFTGGMTNNLSYKGFELNILFTASYGNEIYNATRMYTESMDDGKNQSTTVLRRWQRPGQITDVPRAVLGTSNNLLPSTRFLEDGSYFKIKNVTLAYNFNPKWMTRAFISRLQLYVTFTNLLTLTKYSGYDPEVNNVAVGGGSSVNQGVDYGTYPQSRSYTIGAKIEF